ncbi:hypothetical protein HMPREF1554_01201, partial [Porphyromonas gingivalis F0569]
KKESGTFLFDKTGLWVKLQAASPLKAFVYKGQEAIERIQYKIGD